MGRAHSGAAGNEVADEYAKSAATGEDSVEEIPEGYGAEVSLSHMTRVATEARSRETAEWISGMSDPSDAMAPSGERPPAPPAQTGEEDLRRPLLSAPLGACGDGALTGRDLG